MARGIRSWNRVGRRAALALAAMLLASAAMAADPTATTQLDSVSVTSGTLLAPVLIEPAPPASTHYPRVALSYRAEGTATVRALVAADGSVTQVGLKRSSGNAAIDAAALAHLGARSFVPARRDGRAVEAWIAIPVTFDLPEDASHAALPVNRLASH